MGWNFNQKHLEIARVLVENIKIKSHITYKELGLHVGMSIGINSDLYWHLGDLSNYSFEQGMPLISVMVVSKEENMPGLGFYEVYRENYGITVQKNERMDVFIQELNKVFAYSDWNKLIELLEKEVSAKPQISLKRMKKIKLLSNRLNKEKNEDKEFEFVEINEFENSEDIEIEEGTYIRKIVEAKKRNSKARKMKIDQFKKDNNGKVFCEVCNENDVVVLDVHHDLVQVANMEEGHKTKLSELRVLCSNCHRKVHGYKITVDELISMPRVRDRLSFRRN